MKRAKKFITLFLILSLMIFSVNLYAKERRGAQLIVTKKDGQQVEGELITVKPNSLLLLDTEGKDASVGIVDIKVIKIEKKSKFWAGVQFGGFIGAVAGALIFLASEEVNVGFLPFAAMSSHVLLGGVIGVIFGGIIGAGVSAGKTIQLEKMANSEIQRALKKLRKKARIRDYK